MNGLPPTFPLEREMSSPPFAQGPGGDGDAFTTTSRTAFVDRDLRNGYVPSVQASDFQGRPLPYAIVEGADSLDRFVTNTAASFKPSGAAKPRRERGADFQGRPLPYATVDNFTNDYVSATKAHFQGLDLSGWRPCRTYTGDFQGRPLPYGRDDGADERRFRTTIRDDFVPLAPAPLEPGEMTAGKPQDKEYSIVTFQPRAIGPVPRDPPPAPETLGFTQEELAKVPASQRTEAHFIKSFDVFKTLPKAAGEKYSSASLLAHHRAAHSLYLSPAAKFRQPVTETQSIGWRWAPGHDGYP